MLELKNIYKTFNPNTPNEVQSLQGINLQVNKGDFLIIVGTNGSGKSTLLNAVAGSFFIDSGEIYLNSKNITKKPEYKRAKYIGRVFQNPFSGTAPDMSIAENLALAALRGKRRGLGWALKSSIISDFKERIKILNMGLEDRLDNVIGKLSGGQRQALTLLMASWLKPDLLLLDEHTAALDPKSAAKIIEETDDIIKKDNLTSIMVTHSMTQAVNLGNRLIMMNKGKIVYDFKSDDKKRLRANDLLDFFNEIKRKEQIDTTTSEMLMKNYI